MASFDQAEFDRLIRCPKEVCEAPAKELKLSGAHWRNDARLIASDGTTGTFSMFMRKNEDFPENFSIGLLYSPHDGRSEIKLLRCNGKHGEFTGNFDSAHPHFAYHIHRANEKAMEAGLSLEKYAEKTAEFASYEEALQYFIRVINLNIKDSLKYFSSTRQSSLF